LEHANAVLADDLAREDVIGVYSGLRPLLQPVQKNAAGRSSSSTKVSREHTVMEVEPGLTAIAGGKYTTYRVMAEDVEIGRASCRKRAEIGAGDIVTGG